MAVTLNRIRRGFYLDSVALMRLSRDLSALPRVESAALMIGSESNKALLDEAGLLSEEGRAAGANDLVMAVRGATAEVAEAALGRADDLLERPATGDGGETRWRPKSLNTALDALPGANLVLISVPGDFAAAEAHKALGKDLHVMMFSDNVPIEDERALKAEARARGRLLMGPDCGTAILGGVPLAFANAVPRGDIGIVSASGTGLQEVSSLIARAGKGISHGIGVGGRDLSDAVGGIMTLMAIDALDADPKTKRIVIISKPPGAAVARRILERVGLSGKPVTVCLVGARDMTLPANASLAPTLTAAAEDALGGRAIGEAFALDALATEAAAGLAPGRHRIRGLYAGGTLCAEAQVVLQGAGATVASNAPVPGARGMGASIEADHTIIDLGADEYTRGRPHPMIDPSVRNDVLAAALADPEAAVLLLDVVIGSGAHDDPAGAVAAAFADRPAEGPAIVASVCGTDDDAQGYSRQVERLAQAGAVVAPSNARAAELAIAVARRQTEGSR